MQGSSMIVPGNVVAWLPSLLIDFVVGLGSQDGLRFLSRATFRRTIARLVIQAEIAAHFAHDLLIDRQSAQRKTVHERVVADDVDHPRNSP